MQKMEKNGDVLLDKNSFATSYSKAFFRESL